jgi:ParB-like chromosome segregation protein Spo0J
VKAGVAAVDSIVVEGRFRRDLGDLSDLVASIRDVGLLHPIVVDRELRLVAGQRRLAACRELGMSEVPISKVTDLDSAAELLTAERDENTCRKPMTASELVALGRALEALEQPRARERQGHGETAPGRNASARARGSVEETRNVVGKALGVHGATYNRMKYVVERAEASDVPKPVRQVAAAALAEMNAGQLGAEPAQRRVRQAENGSPVASTDLGNVGDKRSIPRKKGPARQLRQLADKVRDLGTLVPMIDLDGLTKEEADSIAADLSEGLSALSSLRNQLRKVNP